MILQATPLTEMSVASVTPAVAVTSAVSVTPAVSVTVVSVTRTVSVSLTVSYKITLDVHPQTSGVGGTIRTVRTIVVGCSNV